MDRRRRDQIEAAGEIFPGHFPVELAVEILKSLPVEDLVRFTTVSKSWYSLITSQFFISLYRHQTRVSNNTDLLLVRVYNHSSNKEHFSLHLYDDDDDDDDDDTFRELKRFDFPFKCPNGQFRVIGCVNGVLCLSDAHGQTMILWNPSIRKSVTLPSPLVTHQSHTAFKRNVGYGFTFINNDYKVVRVGRRFYETNEEAETDEDYNTNEEDPTDEEDETGEVIPLEVEIYELSTGSWRTVDPNGFSSAVDGRIPQAYLNGVVHWMGSSLKMIVSFDIAAEVFGTIKLPISLARALEHWNCRITVLQNKLCLVYFSLSCRKFCVWVMEQYGVTESWTQLHSFDRPQNSRDSFGFMKDGGMLLLPISSSLYTVFPGTKLVSYSHKCEQVKDLGVHGSGTVFYVDKFVETLELFGVEGKSPQLAKIEPESSSTKRTEAGSGHRADEQGKSANQAKIEAESEDEADEGKSPKQAKVDGKPSSRRRNWSKSKDQS